MIAITVSSYDMGMPQAGERVVVVLPKQVGMAPIAPPGWVIAGDRGDYYAFSRIWMAADAIAHTFMFYPAGGVV